MQAVIKLNGVGKGKTYFIRSSRLSKGSELFNRPKGMPIHELVDCNGTYRQTVYEDQITKIPNL